MAWHVNKHLYDGHLEQNVSISSEIYFTPPVLSKYLLLRGWISKKVVYALFIPQAIQNVPLSLALEVGFLEKSSIPFSYPKQYRIHNTWMSWAKLGFVVTELSRKHDVLKPTPPPSYHELGFCIHQIIQNTDFTLGNVHAFHTVQRYIILKTSWRIKEK